VPFSVTDVRSQSSALKKILGLIEKGSIDPDVRRVALQITRECPGKDDLCELQAIFDAVKHGTDAVPFLRNGFKYVADPRAADFYMGAKRILSECVQGSCGGDCDDHTILIGSLCAALGFKVGARAWGPDPKREAFTHVYAVVAVPKKGPWPNGYTGHGMDTTVEQSRVGWEPPKRRAITMWLEEEA
jgi:hypothetical protein